MNLASIALAVALAFAFQFGKGHANNNVNHVNTADDIVIQGTDVGGVH